MLTLLPELQSAAFNLGVALICGSLIGTERQARKRTAGVRTNALVAIGAAAFVIFAARYTGEASPTRVAAQIVSGIGFLGAGIIFRDGLNVHGLNTAATLWCSAGVGMLAGSGAWHLALLLTGFVAFVNIGMRPLVKWLKKKSGADNLQHREYHVTVNCRSENEAKSREEIMTAFDSGPLKITSIASAKSEDSAIISLDIVVTGPTAFNTAIESAVKHLARNPNHVRVHWQTED